MPEPILLRPRPARDDCAEWHESLTEWHNNLSAWHKRLRVWHNLLLIVALIILLVGASGLIRVVWSAPCDPTMGFICDTNVGMKSMPQIAKGSEAPIEGGMRVTRTSVFTGRTRSFDWPVTAEQFTAWRNGVSIQDAFPQLSTDQREFLMTGAWEGEFEAAVPDED